MINDNPTPSKIDKNWLLAAILSVGTLLYVIAVFWIGFGSIQHVSEINAAPAANPDPVAGQDAQQSQNGAEPRAALSKG